MVLDQTLPKHIMKDLFLAHMALQLHQPAELFRSLMEPISSLFPHSTYIKSQWATLRYDLRGMAILSFQLQNTRSLLTSVAQNTTRLRIYLMNCGL